MRPIYDPRWKVFHNFSLAYQRNHLASLILLTLPIGNKGDITLRGKKVLEEECLFFVEDTRSFKSFLDVLEISLEGKEVFSLHDHSDQKKLNQVLDALQEGKTVVYASEAGSPVISDPAHPLLVKCQEHGIEWDSFSGVTAPIVALELSGLPPYPFSFHGFLPKEKEKRSKKFLELAQRKGTHIFFESPYRIEDSIKILAKALPETQICVARELTKKFQSIHRFKAQDHLGAIKKIKIKGEFVLLFHNKIDGSSEQSSAEMQKYQKLAQAYLEQGGSKKALSKLIGGLLNLSPKEVYNKLN
jgi:16S rRNA (cytidine1402-2'-O)-methyltransferase